MELNVDNIVKCLEYETSLVKNEMSLSMGFNLCYEDIIDNLIKSFYKNKVLYPTNNITNINIPTSNLLLKSYYNINSVEFDLLIPRTIVKLYKQYKLKFTCKEYAKIYCFMVENYYDIKNKLSINTILIFDKIINYVLLSQSNNYNIINNQIVKKHILYFLSKFKNYIITYDYKILIEDKYMNINELNKFNIPYKINKTSVLFIRFDKYCYTDYDVIKQQNLTPFDLAVYGKSINEFTNNVNIENRKNKINNLVGNIK